MTQNKQKRFLPAVGMTASVTRVRERMGAAKPRPFSPPSLLETTGHSDRREESHIAAYSLSLVAKRRILKVFTGQQ